MATGGCVLAAGRAVLALKEPARRRSAAVLAVLRVQLQLRGYLDYSPGDWGKHLMTWLKPVET